MAELNQFALDILGTGNLQGGRAAKWERGAKVKFPPRPKKKKKKGGGGRQAGGQEGGGVVHEVLTVGLLERGA